MPTNKFWTKFTNSRETKPVALTEQFKQYRLVYSEIGFSSDTANIVITAIEDDIILAIHFTNYKPTNRKAEITIIDGTGVKKGILYIEQQEVISVEGTQIYLYKIITARSYSLHFFPVLMNHIVYGAKRKFKYNPKEGKRLHDLFVFYIKPRPVSLLSVKDGDTFDIFPVDLNGIIFDNYFLQSIKSTNKGINLIKKTGAICLSAVPFSKVDLIYKLHEQRKKEKISLENLSFSTSESRMLKIPVPDFAIDVKEFNGVQTFENGLYTTILLKCINMYKTSDDIQFAHMPWYCFKNSS
jgi:hypothetical protein